jgi:glycosyltransferase involved in cell wall biosynthesis
MRDGARGPGGSGRSPVKLPSSSKSPPIPILVLGDAPNLPTGLARIARDVTYQLWAERELLDIEVCQLAHGWDGSPWPWRVFPLFDAENWGEADIGRTLSWIGEPPRVVFSFWDPSRCLPASRANSHRWGYFAIDGDNSELKIGGPALRAVSKYDRVLAYTNYGSRVLAESLGRDAVRWLPHGYFANGFADYDVRPQDVVLGWPDESTTVIGCVATNQARKDLGLVFAALDGFRWNSRPVTLWLHIDREIDKAWSVPELARIYNRNDQRLIVTTSLQDIELAALYRSCKATIAPGLGEGFGYPIIESLACGTPVIHVDYAGGAEWIPDDHWLFSSNMFRIDGPYAIRRPVCDLRDVRIALNCALWDTKDERTTRAYCRGSIANLEWGVLWPRWRSWIKQGLKELKESVSESGAETQASLSRPADANSVEGPK